MAKVMYLPLAEKMLDKFVKENRMTALAELRLFIMVLEMMDKPERVLQVLECLLGTYACIIKLFNQHCDIRMYSELIHCCNVVRKFDEFSLNFSFSLVLSQALHQC